MIIANPQQEQYLKSKLNGILKYRETYAEVHDHIMLAIEQHDGFGDFEVSANNIIEQDFGGEKNLRQMEDRCRVAAIKSVKVQYKQSLVSWFTSAPLLVSLVVTFLLLNYIAIKSFVTAELIFGIIVLVPEVSFITQRIKAGYLSGKAKPSLRDAILKKLTYGSMFILLRVAIIAQSIILLFSIQGQQARYVYQFLITSYAVLFITRATALQKLFKSYIKLSIT